MLLLESDNKEFRAEIKTLHLQLRDLREAAQKTATADMPSRVPLKSPSRKAVEATFAGEGAGVGCQTEGAVADSASVETQTTWRVSACATQTNMENCDIGVQTGNSQLLVDCGVEAKVESSMCQCALLAAANGERFEGDPPDDSSVEDSVTGGNSVATQTIGGETVEKGIQSEPLAAGNSAATQTFGGDTVEKGIQSEPVLQVTMRHLFFFS